MLVAYGVPLVYSMCQLVKPERVGGIIKVNDFVFVIRASVIRLLLLKRVKVIVIPIESICNNNVTESKLLTLNRTEFLGLSIDRICFTHNVKFTLQEQMYLVKVENEVKSKSIDDIFAEFDKRFNKDYYKEMSDV